MTRSRGAEIATWIVAAICVALGVIIAPSNGGSSFIPIAIGVALGFMANDIRKKREAAQAPPRQ